MYPQSVRKEGTSSYTDDASPSFVERLAENDAARWRETSNKKSQMANLAIYLGGFRNMLNMTRKKRRAHGKTLLSRTRYRVIGATLGVVMAGTGAYAATNWVVGLSAGSNAAAQSATVSNLVIAAVATPSPSSLLYPGGTGDVVLTITNPNAFPVQLTAISLPTNTTYAGGYTTSALTTTQTGCLAATPSGVIWAASTGTSGTSHVLGSALTIAATGQANNPLTVTLTNAASMTTAAPAACVNTYFSMPSLTGVTATGGAGTATVSPATDS
jgi:hypothetical protein